MNPFTTPADSSAIASEVVKIAEQSAHSTLAPLLFIIVALFIGTATRYLLRKSVIPYTITLLVIGILLGLANRAGFLTTFWGDGPEAGLYLFSKSIDWAGHINHRLIFFVFLPTLIFEAAFALHVHTFKKSFTNAFILAVPGIMLAIVITAAVAMLLNILNVGLGMWTWPVALMFGTIVSATDPVAVVSILKEVGASKKLGTLIEGESLLNDGTAIVIFMVFLTMITGTADGGSPVLEFVRVALGGVVVGVIVGWLIVSWLKKVFNDALFEITVVVGAAYLAFFVAEHMFHVSGVLAVVSFGLMMAGIGRTRVSPQVAHFLHEFWELAAFIANTLIFIIVGVVIALRVEFTPQDFLILGIVYITILVARAIVLVVFYPLMKRIGYGLSPKDGVVAWWGGLRGAIGLALALIVASEPSIDPEIRTQILSLTAGIVALTSLINATTIKPLIEWLGLTKMGEVRIMLLNQTLAMLRQTGEKEISKLKENRFTSGADWNTVSQYLPEVKGDVVLAKEEDTLYDTRKRLLVKEKECYWRQFSEGLLSPSSVQNLSDEIDQLLDFNGRQPLSVRKDLESMWQTPKILTKLQRIPILGTFWKRILYRRLSLSYDCARGFVVANEENLKSLSSLIIGLSASSNEVSSEVKALSGLEDEINENRIMGLTLLRNLKETYPDIYHAIETQNASRSLLNHQMSSIQKLAKQGRLEPADTDNLESIIQGHMKNLFDSPPSYQPRELERALRSNLAFQGLSASEFDLMRKNFVEKAYPIDTAIANQGEHCDGFLIILRGTARVVKDGNLVSILEPGAVTSIYDLLTGSPRWASVIADSPVTALKMPLKTINRRLTSSRSIMNALWFFAGTDAAERLLLLHEPWASWRVKKLRSWIASGTILDLFPNQTYSVNQEVVITLSGEAYHNHNSQHLELPTFITDGELVAKTSVTIFVIKSIDSKKVKIPEA